MRFQRRPKSADGGGQSPDVVQRRQSEPGGQRFAIADTAMGLMSPSSQQNRFEQALVQLRAAAHQQEEALVRQVAAEGVAGGGGQLPFFEQIQASFGRFDVSGIQAHVGGRAEAAAATVGARAYATGDRVALPSAPDLHTAAHEAAHVVQQRAGVQLAGGVGRAGDEHERHADQVADRVVAGRSAEDLLARYRGGGRSPLGNKPPGQVQRKHQLVGKKDVSQGRFAINFLPDCRRALHTVQAAMKGTLSFTPNSRAPDAPKITLVQAARVTERSGNQEVDHTWGGKDERRNELRTKADKRRGVEPGWFIDHKTDAVKPRSRKSDKPVSKNFCDTFKAAKCQHGYKRGRQIKPATLEDNPGLTRLLFPTRFRFETVAEGARHVFGAAKWEFEAYLVDADNAAIRNAKWSVHDSATATHAAAKKRFDEVYQNPGTPKAPKK